jgi:Asp-tRNA(Asn)/Glu-tRNA(Gln) amidotransferase A subunit family amidase
VIAKTSKNDLSGVRVGVPDEYFVAELPAEIVDVWDQGIQWLRDAGAQVVTVSLPTTKLCIPAYYILACAEASSNLSRYDGVRYGYRYANQLNGSYVLSPPYGDLTLVMLFAGPRILGSRRVVTSRMLSMISIVARDPKVSATKSRCVRSSRPTMNSAVSFNPWFC